VDLQAVINGLESGKLAGAGLDVLENERLDSYSEEERARFQRLLQAGNVVVTPHIAGWTEEARRKIFFIVLDKFEHWFTSRS
jgi:D-3-phosphoglycerate dehydrogenase